MQVQLPVFILSLLVHAGIFLTSEKTDRKLSLMAGLTIVFMTWPLWYSGYMLGTPSASLDIASLMAYAPYYLPILSFLVYYRPNKLS